MAKVFVEEWITVHGVPDSLHSDNGRCYTSELWNETMKILGIHHTFTPPYLPESNRVKRQHKKLGALLHTLGTNFLRPVLHYNAQPAFMVQSIINIYFSVIMILQVITMTYSNTINTFYNYTLTIL